jgi:hypothetical protein
MTPASRGYQPWLATGPLAWQALVMAIRLGSTVINCADMELMTGFWSQALDLAPSSQAAGDDFRVLRGEHVGINPLRR